MSEVKRKTNGECRNRNSCSYSVSCFTTHFTWQLAQHERKVLGVQVDEFRSYERRAHVLYLTKVGVTFRIEFGRCTNNCSNGCKPSRHAAVSIHQRGFQTDIIGCCRCLFALHRALWTAFGSASTSNPIYHICIEGTSHQFRDAQNSSDEAGSDVSYISSGLSEALHLTFIYK